MDVNPGPDLFPLFVVFISSVGVVTVLSVECSSDNDPAMQTLTRLVWQAGTQRLLFDVFYRLWPGGGQDSNPSSGFTLACSAFGFEQRLLELPSLALLRESWVCAKVAGLAKHGSTNAVPVQRRIAMAKQT